MVLESLTFLVQPPITTLVFAWAGLIVSFYTIQTFNLRLWQISSYYFLTGLIAFILYAFIESFRFFLDVQSTFIFLYVGLTFKALSLFFITLGVYKVRKTAKTLGA